MGKLAADRFCEKWGTDLMKTMRECDAAKQRIADVRKDVRLANKAVKDLSTLKYRSIQFLENVRCYLLKYKWPTQQWRGTTEFLEKLEKFVLPNVPLNELDRCLR